MIMSSVFLSNELALQYASFKDMIQVFVSGGVGGIGLLLLTHLWRKIESERLSNKYTPIFRDLLHEHIYSNQQLYSTNLQHIKLPLDKFKMYNLSRRPIRQVLVNSIVDCRSQFPGEKKKLLKKLYKDLDLELYTILDLDTFKGKYLVAALEELMVMDIIVDEQIIAKFLTHKEVEVQKITEKYLQKIQLSSVINKNNFSFSSIANSEIDLEVSV